MRPILDAGALIAAERGDRFVWQLIKRRYLAGQEPVTHAGVVAQVWRGGGRQARLSVLLSGVEIVPIDEPLARRAGELIARAKREDVIDAALVQMAFDGDAIFTSDPSDISALAEAAGLYADIVRV